ncbi:hypothetical protein AYJ08_05945 [Brevibacillus sp. SKDU10]|uniref:hypothetical protein n=1 Tax=Brevibacillus sp. SKDU10 TaxID=1247872 RepID=UPI0007C961E1|nr:hypothetical protein [Brevibacillus sp. SKDU10]OAJ75155.1 hypothetical protein AYJ08_05945 [Brevibacillus sp. SKDU10]
MEDYSFLSKLGGSTFLFIAPFILRKLFENETELEKVERELLSFKFLKNQDFKIFTLSCVLLILIASAVSYYNKEMAVVVYLFIILFFLIVILVSLRKVTRISPLIFWLFGFCLTLASAVGVIGSLKKLVEKILNGNSITFGSMAELIFSLILGLAILATSVVIFRGMLYSELNSHPLNQFIFVFTNGEVLTVSIKSITRDKNFEIKVIPHERNNCMLSSIGPSAQIIINRITIQSIIQIKEQEKIPSS